MSPSVALRTGWASREVRGIACSFSTAQRVEYGHFSGGGRPIFRTKKLFWLAGITILLIAVVAVGFSMRARQAAVREQKKKALRKTISEGMKYFQKGKFDQAVSELEKAVELDPENAKAHLNLAQSYEATGNLDKATEAYQTSLDINPDRPEALYNLAIIYKSKGKTKEAIRELEKAIGLRKDFVAARLILAELYVQQGEKEKAKDQYQAVIEMKPFGTDLAEIEKKLDALK